MPTVPRGEYQPPTEDPLPPTIRAVVNEYRNFEDRRNEAAPAPEGDIDYAAIQKQLEKDAAKPASKLAKEAGADDIKRPSKEEMMDFFMSIEAFNPDPVIKKKR